MKKLFSIALTIIVCFLFIGCMGYDYTDGVTLPPLKNNSLRPLFAYTINAQANTIATYTINKETGLLTQIGQSIYNKGGLNPQAMTVSSDFKYLYVANNSVPTITSYSIDPVSQLLSPIDNGVVACGLDPWSIKISPDGKYAYVGNNKENSISQYIIDSDSGRFIPMESPKIIIPDCLAPAGTTFSPDEKFFYVACWSSNIVKGFKYNSENGEMIPLNIPMIKTEMTPRAIKFDRFGNVYIINQNSNSLSLYKYNEENGALTPKAPYVILTNGSLPSNINFSTDDKVMLVFQRNSGSIATFSFESKTGAFTHFEKSQRVGTLFPGGASFDNYGHAYVLNRQGASISQYKLESGEFIPLNPAIIHSELNPWGMIIAESNLFYY